MSTSEYIMNEDYYDKIYEERKKEAFKDPDTFKGPGGQKHLRETFAYLNDIHKETERKKEEFKQRENIRDGGVKEYKNSLYRVYKPSGIGGYNKAYMEEANITIQNVDLQDLLYQGFFKPILSNGKIKFDFIQFFISQGIEKKLFSFKEADACKTPEQALILLHTRGYDLFMAAEDFESVGLSSLANDIRNYLNNESEDSFITLFDINTSHFGMKYMGSVTIKL